MSTTLLNDLQRQRLRDLASTPIALAAYVIALNDQYPEAFHHTKDTMAKRVFMDEPMHVTHYARFVRAEKDSPHRVRIVPVSA